MPIEIRELIIKATVNKTEGGGAATDASSGVGASDINRIADRVFEIIKEKSER